MPVLNTLNGQRRTRRQLAVAVKEAVGVGFGTPSQVVDYWGDDLWREHGLKQVSLIMINLCKDGEIERVEQGVYGPISRDVGRTERKAAERKVLFALGRAGGLATEAELRELAVNVSDAALADALAHSQQIRRDFAREGMPLVNLHPQILASLPCTGRLAAEMVRSAGFKEDESREYRRTLSDFFYGIGSAIQHIATEKGIAATELAQRHPIKAALHHLGSRLSPEDLTPASYEQTLWREFLDGKRWVHLAAPCELYEAVADALEIDAVLLSRGMLSAPMRRTDWRQFFNR